MYRESTTESNHDMSVPADSNQIPDVFCWTKMGVEAGQSLEAIIRRKELERASGNGVFVWGIGNSLGNSLREFGRSRKKIPILFSPIQSKPRLVDVRPSNLVIWLSYLNEDGKITPLPEHTLVTSRSDENAVISNKRHYALFCHSDQSLMKHQPMEIDFNELRNVSSNKSLGFSQVTSLVRRYSHNIGTNSVGRKYSVRFKADLFGAYCVRLMDGICVSSGVADQITEVAQHASPAEWATYVHSLQLKTKSAQKRSCMPLFESEINRSLTSYQCGQMQSCYL